MPGKRFLVLSYAVTQPPFRRKGGVAVHPMPNNISKWNQPFRILQKSKEISGWWLNPTPLKTMKVNWDDEIPNIIIHNQHMEQEKI